MFPVRCLQTCTAAAVLFALLGACGLAPPRPARVIVRPRAPRAEVTIRSLTGIWDGAVATPAGGETVTMSLAQAGDSLNGALTMRGRTLCSDPTSPARIDVNGGFVLEFGQTHEQVVVRGRPDGTGLRIAASLAVSGAQPAVLEFVRR